MSEDKKERVKTIETPLAEITLRRYEKPYNLPKRDLVMKLCLSLGLLQPGDSRDIIVDILYVMLANKQKNLEMSSFDIKEQVVALRREHGLPLLGVADSNIRRQLLRLRSLYLIEKVKNNYRVNEFESLATIYTERIEQYVISQIVSRVKEYVIATDEAFKTN
jgi:hypothetical protein